MEIRKYKRKWFPRNKLRKPKIMRFAPERKPCAKECTCDACKVYSSIINSLREKSVSHSYLVGNTVVT